VTANYFVLGLGVAGVLVMAMFSARVLGYLEWGGWTARWSGREETKVLHAAAALARLKIQQAEGARELVRAIAIFAAEIGCREVVVCHGDGEERWTDPFSNPGDKPDSLHQLEVPMSEDLRFRYMFDSDVDLDPERQQLIEELSRLLANRLVRDG
jgi:hypothetical protein